MPILRSQKRTQSDSETPETKPSIKMPIEKYEDISQWIMIGPGMIYKMLLSNILY